MNNCICCHAPIEHHPYFGVVSVNIFFTSKRDDKLGPLCSLCYRMLFREQVIEESASRKLAFAKCPECGREMSEKGCAIAYDKKNGRGPYEYYGNTLREARKKKEA